MGFLVYLCIQISFENSYYDIFKNNKFYDIKKKKIIIQIPSDIPTYNIL